ncbi:ArsR family transcriptional regulator [Lentzea sp. NBRC 105346]|uniref:arsenate reductase/protein-tyrosine-phosphatase family protein n=1 Tax=Lentzea sp. NBRC 105346 TaxID=3032205 RepID=UPI0024A34F77|nr:ArsR family transcriptional regulator [Lentzea sp. NBRC 105346]GLZ35682.1 ArsR family transcriptional regulator [Lentzea sp. NBRC 105346]
MVPAFLRLAAHPLRWRLLTELAASDYRVRELTDLVGEPQNLISYHLRLLRDGGLVAARRSSFDGRDTYYHLDLDRCAGALAETGAALHPALRPPTPTPVTGRVLFACTGNSARSPVAEALLRHHTGGQVEVTSAGSNPKPQIDPHAAKALREHYGIDIADRRPRPLEDIDRFDHVITLCDKVREVLRDRPVIHWSIPEPDQATVDRVIAEIDTRVRYLIPVLTEVRP